MNCEGCRTRWPMAIPMLIMLIVLAFGPQCSFGSESAVAPDGAPAIVQGQGGSEQSPPATPEPGRWQKRWQGMPQRSPGGGDARPGKDLQGELKLTPQQSEQLKVIRSKYQDRQEDLLFTIREKKMDLVKGLREAQPDRKSINRKLDDILKLEGDRQRLIVDEFFEVRQILTPDQIKIFTRKAMRTMMRN
jgi:Spy/CpxP family protein refolding chaperone